MKTLINIAVMLVIATTCQGREVLNEITQNTRLNGNSVYYVDNPPLLIHGLNAPIEVIIPAGTTFVIKEDFNVPAIKIYDQAMVWWGLRRGMTGPNDIPSQDDANISMPPIRIIGESGNPFTNNYIGILVERTASSSIFFNNIIIRGFYHGAIVDKPLDFPMSGLCVIDCWNGIQSYGSTKIMNSYVSNFGLGDDPDYDGYAFECFATSRDESVVYDDAEYVLYRCLANDGGYAFNGHGLGSGTPPTIYTYDCAATNTYSAFNLWDGYINYYFLCSGFFNDLFETNYGNIILDYPAYDFNDPIVTRPSDHRIFLNPDSNFVDMGHSAAYNSGWTTRIDGVPDNDLGDIWPSYPTKSWSGLNADIDNDGIVDINDLIPLMQSWCYNNEGKKADLDTSGVVDVYDAYIMFDHWLFEDFSVGDISDEPIVNFKDFAMLARHWQNELHDIPNLIDLNGDGITNFVDFAMLVGEWYSIEETRVDITNLYDPNGMSLAKDQTVSGKIGVSITNPPLLTTQFSAYVDELLVGTYVFGTNTGQSWITIPTEFFCNGWHELKVSTFESSSGKNTNYKPMKICFNNLITNISTSDFFDPAASKPISGFYDGNQPLEVKVKNRKGSDLWSQVVEGNTINLQIPGSVFADQILSEISIKPSGESSSGGYSGLLAQTFRIEDHPSIRVVFLLPDPWIRNKFMSAINAWIDCFIQRGIILSRIVVLSCDDMTLENMQLAFGGSGRRYGLYFGHGNSYAGDVQRSFIQAWKKKKTPCGHMTPICLFPSYYVGQTYAFSYTTQTYAGEPLPGNWDTEGIDLSLLYLTNSKKVEQMWMFGCRLGEYADMAETFGMFSDWNMGHYDQIYGGFDCNIIGSSMWVVDTVTRGAVNGSVTMAQSLGQHQSVWNAFKEIEHNGNSNRVYWGFNGVMDIGEPASDDNFIPYGSWDLGNMRIEPMPSQ